jgi:hypothetical protein
VSKPQGVSVCPISLPPQCISTALGKPYKFNRPCIYNTHRINTLSFRIGAATYYAMLGLNEDEIKLKRRGADGAQTHTNVILDYNSVLVYFRFTNRLDC